MELDQSISTIETTHARFFVALAEATRIKDAFVIPKWRWYKTNARTPAFLFRSAGILIIFLSASLPFLATLEGVWRGVVLPVVALLVAALTGLNAFYQWEQDWKSHRLTQYKLEYQMTLWEIQVAQARQEPDEQQAIEHLWQATRALIDQTEDVTRMEAEQYYKRQRVPGKSTEN
jgi:hypothetical protein